MSTLTKSSLQPIIPTAERLGDVQEYYFSTKLRELAQLQRDGHDVINLGIGSPDLPPAPEVISALARGAQDPAAHGYQPYTGRPELRQGFARWYQRYFGVDLDPEAEILPLIGSKEGIMHISMAYLNAGDEALVPNPGYPTYRSATELAGGVVRPYELSAEGGWLPDLASLEAQDLSRVRIMWVNYPHMPTGAVAPAGFFEELIAFARRKRILLVNDNPYAFILTETRQSLLAIPGAREVAIELSSLSKAQNLAGWRVGALAGAREYLNTVLRFKSNMDSGMFRPVQEAAVVALDLGQDWYDELNGHYRRRQVLAMRIMDALGCAYDPEQVGLFVWARCPTGQDGYAVSDAALYANDVFLTPGGIFGSAGREYVRISLCATETRLAEALARLSTAP
ncbi:aminotransferase class I/II-fold pyridoxal phosphate-dependent enzyme [Neolewinella lacunae]|uniref:Aminotransferase n=1 Tax=Neolewinella lacunae TaxID=1517758 RepID=A0A923PF15_9BACT|nr:aminotransferase class I/II-fold pyridoxal phosphate-dependent enzyme [Neolewinella lacunae]MBC6992880.1 aminotransferase class I/II-fold pyridoxal phosphate-dependent enzyme [Neolewinella lacunae]MDN3633756.1 aminotransferase class I/II-fold pyridoxal phosphate-dependent enzyme [Neolewinella lacunae]